ncbi:MAG: 1-deoxy-D-xylulose-5-phosphate reductoisomerase [Acidimicrobiales bacterium]
MKTVSLVGSTGSIGTQAVDVVGVAPDRYRVVALAAQRSVATLADQARRLRPELVAIGDPEAARELEPLLPPGTELMTGPAGLVAAATAADVVLNAVVGFAGLPVTLAALESGRRLALANKESLIAGAPVVQRARRTPGAQILPVDSEHCAIHQCLSAVEPRRARPDGDGWMGPGDPMPLVPDAAGDAPPTVLDRFGEVDPHERAYPSVARLLVTASGGPFRGRSLTELESVRVADALSHPTWSMGPKITVDSSTLMNKGLEVIEAHELFGLPYDRIDVVVHPQSVVHSMVEMVDGSTIAQVSQPDMRLPIGYALGWPERLEHAFGAVDWTAPLSLTFEPPDRAVFRCLDLAYAAGRAGAAAPAWLNAANEVAVAAFLDGRLDWLGIPQVVADVLDRCDGAPLGSADDVLDADRRARVLASLAVERRLAAV